MLKTQAVFYDWKDPEGAGVAFAVALKALGLYAYPAPSCEGADMFGFIISNKPLSDKELRKQDPGLMEEENE